MSRAAGDRRRTAVLLVLLCTLCALKASAQEPPPLTAPVNDFAQVIDAATERELDRRIRTLRDATGDTLVVATVRSVRPSDVESFALKMFENGGRGVGDRGKDNGLLMLVAVDDRRVRIEVGYDLEAFVTDGFAGDVIRTAMAPRFAAGDYAGGVLAGATRLVTRIAERRGAALRDVPRQDAPPAPSGFPTGLVLFIAVMIVMGMLRSGRRRRRRGPWIVGGPWSGWNSGVGPFGGGTFGGGFGGFGGGGGGFGGFGGGRSGGGGASGSW
jgi:uncharacterized protein